MVKRSKSVDAFYLNDYEKIMSTGLIGQLWRHIHRSMDLPFIGNPDLRIIEVGSGNGQHFNLTRLHTSEYLELDLRAANNSGLDPKKCESLGRKFMVGDAIQLNEIKDDSFDGLIATCLLAHLSDIELALENWRRVVRPGGILSIYIPNEPGLLLRLSRFLTTKRKITKSGYNHEYIHWREHRNHYPAMRSSIKHVFESDIVTLKNFPFPFFGWNLGLYTLVKIKKNS
jgi:phosphatidylethanolamine/phosphatidyl-N-methylethanolamine N-methyltransferase